MKIILLWTSILFTILSFSAAAEDNRLTEAEKTEGWILLFDGKSTEGWLDSKEKPIDASHIQDAALNPHPCDYMLIHRDIFDNFKLSLEFRISQKCNSGVFVRTFPLTPRPGRDVGFNGIEIAIDDTTTSGYHDTGAIYDLVQPSKNAMKKVGEWNHLLLTCDRNRLEVVINREKVNQIDLDQWTTINKRPDGSTHKFDIAYKDHPRRGYIGLQDHGSDAWYRNIKILKLK